MTILILQWNHLITTFYSFWPSWALHTKSLWWLLWRDQGFSPEHYGRCDPQPSGCSGKEQACTSNLWKFRLWPRFWAQHDCSGAQWRLCCKLHPERLKAAQLHYSRRRRLHECYWSNLWWVIWHLLWGRLIIALLLVSLLLLWSDWPSEHRLVRLVEGHDRCAGRVELLDSENWGTVCDDDFNATVGNIVCAQLKCGSAVRLGFFGAGKGAVHISKMKCNGSESNLWECSSDNNTASYCGHKEDAGVVCSGTTHMHT